MKEEDADLLALRVEAEKFEHNYEYGMNCCTRRFTFAHTFKNLLRMRKIQK